MGQKTEEFESRVVVVGVGLIGGSIAAAVRARYPDCEVVGVGRSAERLEAAQAAGLLTSYTTRPVAETCSGRCLVVVCLPVHLIARTVLEFAELSSSETVVTDAGSVKGIICEALPPTSDAGRKFVPAHPIAGGEQGGFEFADEYLFDDRVCVLVDGYAAQHTDRVAAFWQAIGCRIQTLSAADHDQKLALTSHLPHVMATITTSVVGPENLPLTGSGFRDTTRIAAGDPALWRSILTANRRQTLQAIDAAAEQLEQFRRVLASSDDDRLEELLRAAAECRSRLNGAALNGSA